MTVVLRLVKRGLVAIWAFMIKCMSASHSLVCKKRKGEWWSNLAMLSWGTTWKLIDRLAIGTDCWVEIGCWLVTLLHNARQAECGYSTTSVSGAKLFPLTVVQIGCSYNHIKNSGFLLIKWSRPAGWKIAILMTRKCRVCSIIYDKVHVTKYLDMGREPLK
jgi:hypothetical protein